MTSLAENLVSFYTVTYPKCIYLRYFFLMEYFIDLSGGAWLAQSEERATLDLGIVSSSPLLGVELTKKIFFNKINIFFKRN